ncbi:MAG TPA: hypothetical protein VFM37_12925 [Pseudonocardiaceae bacterium]|nr:hypothetical protein [Pseudonocardiaceae bacterium]
MDATHPVGFAQPARLAGDAGGESGPGRRRHIGEVVTAGCRAANSEPATFHGPARAARFASGGGGL